MVFASMRELRLFSRARAVVKFVLQALEKIQMASSELFVIFPLAGISLSFIRGKRCFAPSNLTGTSKTNDNRRKAG